MPSVLITGARAPAALELVRAFGEAGWACHTADSFRFTVCSGSRFLRQHHVIPSPRSAWESFRSRIRSLEVDLIVPTCEEVFYLAGLPNAFCAPRATLLQLHSKWEFLEVARGLIGVPFSRLATCVADLPEDASEYVFKREFSRFGSFTHVGSCSGLQPSLEQRWVVQKRLRGTEISSYAVALRGELTAWSLYRPVHRIGSASSVYFRHHEDERALQFTRAVVSKLGYTGQIGFDFMDTAEGLFVLECNPRATSGIHLLGRGLAAAFTDPGPLGAAGGNPGTWIAGSGERMLAAAMPLAPKSSAWLRDFRTGRDVLWRKDDPWPAFALVPHLAETLWRSVRDGCSLKDASTADIEWDGPPTGGTGGRAREPARGANG